MTKSNYTQFVKIIKQNTYGFENERKCIDYPDFIRSLCAYFKQDNPRFSEERFREALK